MNSDSNSPKSRQEELESRLTALLLGQLSPEEEAALRQSMAADENLQRLHARLKATVERMRETAASSGREGLTLSDAPRLSAERRETLRQAFKVVRPKGLEEVEVRRVRRRELAAIAAMVMGLVLIASLVVYFQDRDSMLMVAGNHPAKLTVTAGRMAGERKEKGRLTEAERLDNPVEADLERRARFSRQLSDSERAPALATPAPSTLLPARPPAPPVQAASPGAMPGGDTRLGTKIVLPVEQSLERADAGLPIDSLAGGTAGGIGAFGATDAGQKQKPLLSRVNGAATPESTLGFEPKPDASASAPVRALIRTENASDLNLVLRETNTAAGDAQPGLAGDRILIESGFRRLPTLQPLPGLGEASVSKDAQTRYDDAEQRKLLSSGISVLQDGLGVEKSEDKKANDESWFFGKELAGQSTLSYSVRAAEPMPSAHIELKGITTIQGPQSALLDLSDSRRAALAEQLFDDALKREETDGAIPEAGGVTIVQPAEPAAPGQRSLWGTIRDAFGNSTEATARISVQKQPLNLQSQGLAEQPVAAFDPYWVQSAAEEVESKPVLDQVIEQLNLNEAWGERSDGGRSRRPDDTSRRLREMIDVRQDDKSGNIDIQVKGANAAESARIANAVAEAYRDQRSRKSEEVHQLAKKTVVESRRLETSNEPAMVAKNTNVELFRTELLLRRATNAPVPQPEVLTAENAYSTFSLNVSDVSFKLAAASLEQGQMPDASTLRTEEFINAFDYRDPEPPSGVPIGFRWERAHYPFAHNRDLLRLSLKTAASGRQAGRPLNLVLLLDNSGSMERADRVRIRQECLRVLASQLQPQDRVSVVSFARTSRLWVDGLPGAQAGELSQRVGHLTPEGGTNLEDALNLAYQTARRHFQAAGVNRVVLLTDGAANLGDVQPESLKKNVEAHRQQGVALDCFGIGWDGYNDDLLETLSRNGDGRYGFINSPEAAAGEFAGQLAGALRVAASDVKVQVEFNPRRVTAHRQMGYAKHQLKKEQFRDNTVDAAEIGAAESGNALYVVEVNPRGEGPLGVVRVRFKVPGTQDYREHEWPLAYDGAAKAFEQSSPAMRLAGTAAAFGEWLAASPFAAEVTPDRLLRFLNGVPETYAADPRPKKLEGMLRQAGSLAGR